MATSFVQYCYCELCKFNHNQKKKKHIYSKRHQLTLKAVLKKFGGKVDTARQSLQTVEVQPCGWEREGKVWCYMCVSEVNRHQHRHDCTLVNAAFLTHLASSEHSQKTHEFFWENMVSLDKKTDFIVSMDDVKRFMVNAEAAVAKYLKMEKDKLLQETDKIRAADRHSQEVTYLGRWQQRVTSSHRVRPVSSTVTSSSDHSAVMANTTAGKAGILGGKRTVYASGPGLTCIALPQEDSEEGNIHTGATPPWLKQDDKEGSGEIGPTAEAFQKHLQSLQKKKLPTGRVGATFSHKVDTSQQWLPAFGRVWNSGRRLNSQQQFLREKSRDGGKRHSANHSARRSWPTTPQRGVDEAVPSGSSETYFREEHATGQEAIVPYWKRPPMACHDEGGGFSSVQVNGAATSSHCDGVHPAYTHVHNYGAQSSRPGKAMLVAAEMEAVKKKRPWESTAPIRTKTTTSATPEEEERGGFVKLPLAYRPYKRQRTGQTTHTGTPVSTPVMIPIVSKLLSEPAGIKHHSL